jgi:ribonucleotide monophosphatase NagD (HAD superfamily)
VPANKIAMIGDRLTTDMAFAERFGFTGILVLSGETTQDMLKKSYKKPNIVKNSVADICFL